MHEKGVPGSPDFYFPAELLAVFVDGCFWHGCPRCGHIPHTRRPFWQAKISQNRKRDRRARARLSRLGIRVIRIWEHALREPGSLRRAVAKVAAAVGQP